jgi:hypothetical protein
MGFVISVASLAGIGAEGKGISKRFAGWGGNGCLNFLEKTILAKRAGEA